MSSPQDHGASFALLGDNDPPPVHTVNPQGASSFLLTGDHAGTGIPAALGTLGLSSADLGRHIAVDLGIQPLGEALSLRLDAPFIAQHYSRLVVDCNRAPGSLEAMPEISDGTTIPGNVGLSDAQRDARINAIHTPYQVAIAQALAERDAANRHIVLVALHSFTPVMGGGAARPWQVGVLHSGGNAAFARRMLDALRDQGDLVVGDNAPYRMDETDHSVPRHAFAAMRPYVELEIRQDLLEREEDIVFWCDRLAIALLQAVSQGRAGQRLPAGSR